MLVTSETAVSAKSHTPQVHIHCTLSLNNKIRITIKKLSTKPQKVKLAQFPPPSKHSSSHPCFGGLFHRCSGGRVSPFSEGRRVADQAKPEVQKVVGSQAWDMIIFAPWWPSAPGEATEGDAETPGKGKGRERGEHPLVR